MLESDSSLQVMIAHQNVIAQCLQIQQIVPPDLTKTLAVLPAFHSENASAGFTFYSLLTRSQLLA